MPQTARIPVSSLKVTLPLKPDQLPRDLVPPEPQPTGSPVFELALEGGFVARAQLNGKNYRKLLKQVAAHDPADIVIVLQGTLKAPAAKGGPFVLEGAGFQVNVKTPKPAPPKAGDQTAGK